METEDGFYISICLSICLSVLVYLVACLLYGSRSVALMGRNFPPSHFFLFSSFFSWTYVWMFERLDFWTLGVLVGSLFTC